MASGFPDFTPRMFTSAQNREQVRIAAAAGDNLGTFAQQVKSVLLYNDGPNPIHIEFDAVAVATDFMVPSKAWLFIDLEITILHAFCAVGHTATVYLVGFF